MIGKRGWWVVACTFLSATKTDTLDARQNVLVIYFCFRDVREITRSYNNTDKSEKQSIKLIEMINCPASQGHRT